MSDLVKMSQFISDLGFDEYGYDLNIYYPTRRFSVTIWMSDLEDAEKIYKLKEQIRNVKSLLGPLKARGEPPYVDLVGEAEFQVDDLLIKGAARIYGAYKCEITHYEDVEKPFEPEQVTPAQPARIEQKPVYECKPVDLNGLLDE